MIADLDRSIEQLLMAEIPIKNGEIDIKFEQPKREWSARLSRPTINFFLYDIRENNVLRQHQWQRIASANDRSNGRQVQQKRTPFRVDCLYMMTTWASEPQDEHRLISRCMTALFRNPIIPKKYLQGEMKDQPFDLQTRLASHDKLTNPAELWGSLDNEIRPSISFLVTIAIDPWTEISGEPVFTVTLRTGQAENLPRDRAVIDGTVSSSTYIAGTVRAGEQPQTGIQVAIKGTGLVATTNAEGQFTLGSLAPGEHTLIAWPDEGKPKERPISVPGTDYDIEL